MTEKKYIDMDGMQERVDAAHKAHLDKVWDKVQDKTNEVIERNQELDYLFAKAMQQEIDEEETKVIAEMEAEKVKAIKGIEERYGRKSTKMQVAKQEDDDEDLKEMLRKINGRQ